MFCQSVEKEYTKLYINVCKRRAVGTLRMFPAYIRASDRPSTPSPYSPSSRYSSRGAVIRRVWLLDLVPSMICLVSTRKSTAMTLRLQHVLAILDEIISLIIYQLVDPASLSMTSKRFYRISKDPYVRSSYFLSRYGPQHAFYWALSRSKLVDERVLDVRTLTPLRFGV